MAELKLIIPDKKFITDAVVLGIDDAVKSVRDGGDFALDFLQYNVSAYIEKIVLNNLFAPLHRDFDKYLKGLFDNTPRHDKKRKYDHLKSIADTIVWHNFCLKEPMITANVYTVRNLYDDAAVLARQLELLESRALSALAEDIPYIMPVFERIPEKVGQRFVA